MNARVIATTLGLAAVLLVVGVAKADVLPTIHMNGGYTVEVLGNTTFMDNLSANDYNSFTYGNANGDGIFGNDEHSGQFMLRLTADPGLRFTTINVGTYGGYHIGWGGVTIQNTLTVGDSYGPDTLERRDYSAYYSSGWGNADGPMWPDVPVYATSTTVTFSEYLYCRGAGDQSAGPSSITPYRVFINATPSVPEPATLSLLALGGLGLIRRGRR